jgi:hypothetical protein
MRPTMRAAQSRNTQRPCSSKPRAANRHIRALQSVRHRMATPLLAALATRSCTPALPQGQTCTQATPQCPARLLMGSAAAPGPQGRLRPAAIPRSSAIHISAPLRRALRHRNWRRWPLRMALRTQRRRTARQGSTRQRRGAMGEAGSHQLAPCIHLPVPPMEGLHTRLCSRPTYTHPRDSTWLP